MSLQPTIQSKDDDLSEEWDRRAVPLGYDPDRLERISKVLAFARAFPDLIDDDMPISQVSKLYRATHKALSQAMKPSS